MRKSIVPGANQETLKGDEVDSVPPTVRVEPPLKPKKPVGDTMNEPPEEMIPPENENVPAPEPPLPSTIEPVTPREPPLMK